MAEAIHCPSCSTRYRLRPERLTASIRRAQCFTCQGVFPVGDVVRRIFTAGPEPSATAAFRADEVAAAQVLEVMNPPSLTLGDLEGTEAEILEKTLVEVPSPTATLPEAKPEPVRPPAPPPFPPEITESTLSGYTSARDAIEKLFGDSPALLGETKGPKERSAMDVEATLSALEETLGGTHPTPPSAFPEVDLGEATASGTAAPSSLSAPPSTSTVRFTRDEVMAAMADGGPSTPAPQAPVASAAEPTVALRASDLLAAPSPHDQTQALAAAKTLMTGPLPIPAAAAPAAPEAELLRLKIGEEIYPGLTMPQLTQWVEEGRILEGHQVARQFSEHWIEAYKVPGLRPVFDRLRRERAATQGASLGEELQMSPDSGPTKKSLFGGLFGGKN